MTVKIDLYADEPEPTLKDVKKAETKAKSRPSGFESYRRAADSGLSGEDIMEKLGIGHNQLLAYEARATVS